MQTQTRRSCIQTGTQFQLFTLYWPLNFFPLRFKINKLLIFVVGLAIFLIRFQIKLVSCQVFFFLFKKAKTHVDVELICYWVYLREFKISIQGGQNKNFKNTICKKRIKKRRRRIPKSGGSFEPPEHYVALPLFVCT